MKLFIKSIAKKQRLKEMTAITKFLKKIGNPTAKTEETEKKIDETALNREQQAHQKVIESFKGKGNSMSINDREKLIESLKAIGHELAAKKHEMHLHMHIAAQKRK